LFIPFPLVAIVIQHLFPNFAATLPGMYRRWGLRGMLSELGQPTPGSVQADLS